MENLQSHDPWNGFNLYYSCDFSGCKKTRDKPRRGWSMPSGWFRDYEIVNGKKVVKHYCLKHYNEIYRARKEKELGKEYWKKSPEEREKSNEK